MDWKFYLLFAGMWLVGGFIYSTFGTQIAIMRKCGKRLYYALYKERDSWDAEACRKYMERVKIRCLLIIAIATGLVYWLAGNCFWGYVCGMGFTWLLSRGATGCSATNVVEACKIFLRFAKFGKEDSVKALMEESLEQPEALESIPRPDELPKSNWWKILCVVIAGAAALYGAWYFGVQCGAKAQTEIMTEQNEGYNEGYAEGKNFQRNWDTDKMTVSGQNLKDIVNDVAEEYGIEPAVAYDILNDYNDKPDHGGYSWDEYQEAIQVIIYTVSLIPYR